MDTNPQRPGIFDPGLVYTVEEIALILRKSVRNTKELVMDNFHYARFGNTILVPGRLLVHDIERFCVAPSGADEEGNLPTEPQLRRSPTEDNGQSPRGPNRTHKGK
jgi:hypothetical protein